MKLDLRKDRRGVTAYIEARIRDYSQYENFGPGNDEDSVSLITFSFDTEDDSCLLMVVDTRPDADVDGRWKNHLDNDTNLLEFPRWREAYQTLWSGQRVTVTRIDGARIDLNDDDADELLQQLIGEMIVDVIGQLRDSKAFAKLPLSLDAFVVVEEWGGRFYWPEYRSRKTSGSLERPSRDGGTGSQGNSDLHKLDLRKDRKTLRRYIEKRIREYPIYENLGPGEDEAPIALITAGFYAEQGGYVNLVFDTRPAADVDGQWTLFIDNETNTCPFPHWNAACDFASSGQQVRLIRPDGSKEEVQQAGVDALQAVFGELIADVLMEMRDDGSLARLPLARKAFMVVEEFDGRYFWPTYRTRKTKGRLT